MKKLLFLLLLIPALANATVTASFVPSRTTCISPCAVFFDGSATTSTIYPDGTGSGYLTNGTQTLGATTIAVNTGSGTIVQSQDWITLTTTRGTSSGYVVNGAVLLNDTSIPLITGSGTLLAGNFIMFENDTTHKIYRVTTGIAAPGSVVITPGLGVGFTGGKASEVVDANKYEVTGTLAGGNVTIASPGLLFDGGVSSVAPVTIVPNTRAFHNLKYETNFGDHNGSPTLGTSWTAGTGYNNNRNYALGPEAAHVYEFTPGTGTHVYNAITRITDADGTVGQTVTNTITVSDPDAYFTTTNTVCIAANSDPTPGSGGCPSGADHHQQSNFATAINTYATTGKRILFKRGDTFTETYTTYAILTNTGPGIVGAYGTGANPKVTIDLTGGGSNDYPILGLGLWQNGISDWAVMDLEFDGQDQIHSIGINTIGGMDKFTALRLNMHNIKDGILFNGQSLDAVYINHSVEQTLFDQITIADNTISPVTALTTGWRIYAFTQRLAILGNTLGNVTTTDAIGSHVIRLPYTNKGVIQNNILGRSNGLTIKMHAMTRCDGTSNPNECLVGTSGSMPTAWFSYKTSVQPTLTNNNNIAGKNGAITNKVVISDNKIIGTTVPYYFNIGPQDQYKDERVRDIIMERNWFTGTSMQVHLVATGYQLTIRNNLCDLTGGASNRYCINAKRYSSVSPALPPYDIWAYNNTAYASDSSNTFSLISVDTLVNHVIARNNLAYAPNGGTAGNVKLLEDVAACGAPCITVDHNSTNAEVKGTDPSFASATPSDPKDFRITTGSYGLNRGTSVFPSTYDDFFHCKDKGGTNITAGAFVPAANAMCFGAAQ